MRIGYGLALLGALASAPAFGAGVAAGTNITNTAHVSYTISGIVHNDSASNTFIVDQLIDNTNTWQDAGPVTVAAGSTNQSLLFKLTNTGNGSDSFSLALTASAATGSGFTPTNCRIYFDTDNNGTYSAADTLYVPGSNDPALAGGASVNLLAVCDVPATVADQSQGNVQLVATSKTASGTPGTVKAGGGVGGVDAIVGSSGGNASVTGTFKSANVSYSFVKTETVIDPSGGANPVSGATIEYTLTVTPNGSATGKSLVVTDPIPADTTYVSGSMTLDGTSLGDSNTDGDAGDYNFTTPGAISVKLGNLSGTSTPQVITFKVKIN